MHLVHRCLILALLLLTTLQASPEGVGSPDKDPEAIAILERADQAIRDLHGVRYRADYLGAYTSRGRVTAEVVLRRGSGTDEVMGTTAYSAKFELQAVDAPYAQEDLPERYTLIDGPDGTLLVDPATRTIQTATGQDRIQLNWGGFGSAMLPQYVRPEPFRLEIEDSIGAKYLGTTSAGGVDSHVVWLKFDPLTSGGLGEQLLYFGVRDYLIRKATLVMDRTALPPGESPEAPDRFYPSMFIELTLTDLQLLPEIPASTFRVSATGYRTIQVGNKPAVGDLGPAWTLPLPDGGSISARDLRGKVAVLFFWASWCPTCHGYMPEVQRIHDAFPDTVRVLAINAQDRDDAMAYIRERGYSFEVALDGDQLLRQKLGFIGQPALIVLDPEGIIRYRKLGPGDDQLVPVVAALVANRGSTH